MPTNRSNFLLRPLRYYFERDFSAPMYILDSSKDVITDSELDRLLHLPKIKYIRFDPSIPLAAKLLKGVQQVTTPYTVFWADDDFLVPDTLKACVSFLDDNLDYSAAHGQAGIIKKTPSSDGMVISWVGEYLQTSVTNSIAADRFNAWESGAGTVFYSTQRTKNLLSNLEQFNQYGFESRWDELGLGSLTVIQGKTSKLDHLYMVRELHTDRVSSNMADPFDWIIRDNFAEEYGKFCKWLSEALVQQSEISAVEAREVVKKIFWRYLANILKRKWQSKYGDDYLTVKTRLRQRIKALPGSREAWEYGSRLFPGSNMSLPSLLSSRSPYHADFLPIYNAVRNSVNDVGYKNS